MTEMQVLAIYCFCDNFFNKQNYRDWPNVKMTLAEIRLVYIWAKRLFYGSIENVYQILKDKKYIQKPFD